MRSHLSRIPGEMPSFAKPSAFALRAVADKTEDMACHP